MIIQERKLELTTRDVAPQPGDYVVSADKRRIVRRAVAHWPLMGLWEVAVPGVRQDEVRITVAWSGMDEQRRNTWREVAGR